MKNKFIKSLMNSLDSRERERERERSGGFFMKKESNGIGENKNSKKISKNNKIISSILVVAMCCQSFVGVVTSDSQLVDSKKTVETTECGDLEDKNDDKENDEDENENKNEVDGNTGEDSEDKSESIIDKIKNLPDFVKYGIGMIGGMFLGGIVVRALCNKGNSKENDFGKYGCLRLGYLKVILEEGKGEVYVPTFSMGGKMREEKTANLPRLILCILHIRIMQLKLSND
ncbi:MAG: hypothetical protein CfP315_0382 [Candidatus Improbicoccus pseudotrichonymphae]|uniref:Uncharacterized protein n=1 Tax=Candidatus Improbicoccus pseudotrichonymphae TaxID=3033792 RepID=A0AA48HY31_9FIRM|nr:MAG: hypothetical protein CfP315_0382 [Candidatus Improbicoccus pseudotrichonymphae]